MAKDLTDKAVKAAKALPAKKDRNNPDAPIVRTEYADGKSRGLHLVVQPTGAKSWVLRYRFNDKPKKLTIGPVLDERLIAVSNLPLGEPHTLAEARIAGDRERNRAANGDDPTAHAVRADKLTMADVVDRYIDYVKAQNRSWAETERQLRTAVLRTLGARPIADLSDDEIRATVDRLKRNGSPHSANALHRTLSAFFNWCAAKEQKILPASPYAGFSMPHPLKSRDRVLSWDELAAVWKAAGELGPPYGPIIRALILTGQRREEVAGMRDAEIDRRRDMWTVPAARAKNGEPNPVPLTAEALALIDSVPRIGTAGLIFTGNGRTPFAGWTKAKNRLDAQSGTSDWRVHDLRRTFSTGMEALGVPLPVTEALLNHTSGAKSGIAGVYARHDYAEEKRHAIQMWGRFVLDVVTDDKARDAFTRLRDTRPIKRAIAAGDAEWRDCVKTLRCGSGALVPA